MDGRKDEKVLIPQRRSRFVAGRVRRIKREFTQEQLARRERGGDALERLEMAHPDASVVVARLHERAKPCNSVGDLRRPRCGAPCKPSHEVGEGRKAVPRPGWR